MKKLTCEMCGSTDLIKKDGVFVCQFCDCKYSVEEAKKIMFEGVVEITKGEVEKERLLKNAETFIVLKEYDKAKKAFEDITTMYPNEWRGWWGLFKLPFEEFLTNGNFYMPQNKIFKNAYTLFFKNSQNQCEPFSNFFKKIIDRHGVMVLKDGSYSYTNYDRKYRLEDKCLVDIKLGNYKKVNQISPISLWFITESIAIFNLIDCEFANDFSKKIQKVYINEIDSGELIPILDSQKYTPIIADFKEVSNINSRAYVANLLKKYGYKSIGTLWKKNEFSIHMGEGDIFRINWICGNWISITTGYYDLDTYYYFFENREAISNNRCQYCGGEFKGILKKVCSKCDTPKDY